MRGQAATCIAEMQRCAAIVETGTARARVHGELAFARFMTLDHTGVGFRRFTHQSHVPR